MQREGNRKQDRQEEAGSARAEERHVVPGAGQGAEDVPPREEGPGQGWVLSSLGLEAGTPVCDPGGIPCKSPIARGGSTAFPAAPTPPPQNSHPDSPGLIFKEPLSQAQPLQPELCFTPLSRVRPSRPPDLPGCSFGWAGTPGCCSPRSREGGPSPTARFA